VIREHDWLTDALLMDETGARWHEARLGEVNLFTQRPWMTWVLVCGVTALIWVIMTVIWIAQPSERLVVSERRNERTERALQAGMPDAPCPACRVRSWRADGPIRTSQTPVGVKDTDAGSWIEQTFECAHCGTPSSAWFDSDHWELDEL
jgi:hypothetical protein